MGTDCKDASYNANTDFNSMAQMSELMKAIQTDSTSTQIFLGHVQTCQSTPKSCCNATTGGVSIVQYIAAAKEAYEAYSTLSTGITATAEAMAASATTTINTVASAAGLGTVTTTTTGTTVISTFAGGSTVGAGGTITTVAGASGATVSAAGGGSVGIGASSLLASAATCMAVVGLIVAAYVICTTIYESQTACNTEDMKTSIDLGFNLCHYVGERSSGSVLLVVTKKRAVYCCFASILARLVHEQGRPQIGKSWGTGDNPDCSGFTLSEFANLDFNQMDLKEYMQYVQAKAELSPADIDAIKQKARHVIVPNP